MIENTESDLDQMELHFEVHASLLQQLGDQLITDDIAAVAELVKNSYDADASIVEIEIDPNWAEYDENGELLKGKIEIRDNGFGMNIENVKAGWLTISRSYKRSMKEKGIVTDRFKRLPLGDKGLGRLSAQRLGRRLSVITKKKGTFRQLNVNINWSKFRNDTLLSTITIPVFYSDPPNDSNDKSYTNLIITGLNEPDKWLNSKEVDKFESSLSKITSPFDFQRSFFVRAKIGSRQLEIPQVSKELLCLAPASYYFKVEHQSLLIIGKYRPEFFPGHTEYGDRLNEFMQVIQKDLPRYNTNYVKEGSVAFTYQEEISLGSLGAYDLNFSPGSFEGFLFDYSLDSQNYKTMSKTRGFEQFEKLSDFRRNVKIYKGIKIFRDQFRILPYGENGPGSDWMGLGQSFTEGGSYYTLKPGNVIGYINLTGVENKNLKEKTDREGFIDNGYSQMFFQICQNVRNRINDNREFLRRGYIAYQKLVTQRKEAHTGFIPSYQVAKQEINKAASHAEELVKKSEQTARTVNKIRDIISDSKQKIGLSSINTQEKIRIASWIKSLEDSSNELEGQWREISINLSEVAKARAGAVGLVSQIEITMKQVQEVMELAGLGLTAETLTHELYTLINNTKSDVEDLSIYFRNHFDRDSKIEGYLNSISTRTESLRKQVNHLAPGFKNVRSKREKLNVNEILHDHVSYYAERAKRLGIKLCNLTPNENFLILANKGMIIQILDNLYLNTEFWLNNAYNNKLIDEKKYYIEIPSVGIIHIWDSGLGIEKNMEDRIFEPFITSKPEGRGLGLYIIKRILGYQDCDIQLLEPRNAFGNRYKFMLNLSRMIVTGGQND